MSNHCAVTVPLENIQRVQIYLNNGKKTLSTIKKETGADYIINGTLYNMSTWGVNCHLKADGKVIAKPNYSVYGYAWDEGSDIAMTILPASAKRNYIACTPLIIGGKKLQALIYDKGQGGKRGRSAIGIKDGRLALYCTKDGTSAARTPEALRDDLAKAGWTNAVMLDGGGSSQCNFAGQTVTSSRKVQHLILVYLKKDTAKKEDTKVTNVIDSIKTIISNVRNFGGVRSTKDIKYIVIHYTGNDGDTDTNNGNYFKNNVVKASAHYFVDSDSITQTVKDNVIAWSVGGNKYSNTATTGGGSLYRVCTNANSLSIELCDDVKNGTIYPSEKTIENALELTRSLMEKYQIPKSRVIRHFDVTGKLCPAYWSGTAEKDALWKSEFWNKLDESFTPYLVKITASTLNVRAGAGVKYKVITTVKKNQLYTIVDEKDGWGKLKSGVGWIKLTYTKKC